MLMRKTLLFAVSFILILATIMFSVGAGIDTAENSSPSAQAISFLSEAGEKSEIDILRKGDANIDGRINALDARFVLRVSAKIVTDVSPFSHWAGDVNNDDRLSATDARTILRASANLVTLSNAYIDLQDLEPDTDPPSDEPSTIQEEPSSYDDDSDYSSGYVPVDDVRYKDYPMPAMPAYAKEPGTFSFITFGYGHGVGMSQYGAIYLADSGCGYRDILSHYFSGTHIVKSDEDEIPETIKLPNGSFVETREALARITQQEIAGVTRNPEALKAQVVAAYTFVLNKKNSATLLAAAPSVRSDRQDIYDAVDAVWGEYLTDSTGRPIESLFFALSAGHTTWPSTVWGGPNAFYLTPVDSAFDRAFAGYIDYISVKQFTADEIRALVEKFNEKVRNGKIKYCGEIQLQNNPAEWFEILEHDGVVSDTVGYVSKMRVGNQILETCAGQRLRADLFGYGIRSHCMIIEYYGNNSNIFSRIFS